MRYFLLMLALLAPAAYAQTVEQDGSKDSYSMATERAQNTFFAYQGALEAVHRCNSRTLNDAELLAYDRKVAAEMVAVAPNVSLGAARLQNLRRDAADDMDHRIHVEGCQGPDAQTALDRFNQLSAQGYH